MDSKEKRIRKIVKDSMKDFTTTFHDKHAHDTDNPKGIVNRKSNNEFIATLGAEIMFYSALSRSLDSSLGCMIEEMARKIASITFDVERNIEGPLSSNQIDLISKHLENYKNSSNQIKPNIQDYEDLKNIPIENGDTTTEKFIADYHLIDRENPNRHFLIELKIGGDLDTKKAGAEKRAMMEQYAILSNILDDGVEINCRFATGYNKFGRDKEWKQHQVLKFFSEDELMIGEDFWNFICANPRGYDIVMDEYAKNSKYIREILGDIKDMYI